jgi:hypothetical protein
MKNLSIVVFIVFLAFITFSTTDAQQLIYSINCGGRSFNDSTGVVWLSDQFFNKGHKTIYSPRPITDATDRYLYLSERWCSNCKTEALTYEFNVNANGGYQVKCHFVEHATGSNDQTFQISFNGGAASAVTIFKEVGNSAALVKTYDVTVTNGKLTISLLSGTENARISGIEIWKKVDTVDPCAACPTTCCTNQCYNAATQICQNGVIVTKAQDRQPGQAAYYYNYVELGDNLVNFPNPLKKPTLGFIENESFNKAQDYTRLRNSPWDNYYAVRWFFYLNVPTAGTYSFFSPSNDGTFLIIDGNRIVSNDGNKDVDAVGLAYGTATLTAGEHKVEYDFYQSMHRSGVSLSWKGPNDADYTIIPASVMTYSRNELMPVIMGLDIAQGAVGSTVTLNGFGFVFTAAQTTVKFGTVTATGVTVTSDSVLKVVVPNGVAAGKVTITVQTPNALSNSVDFTITA